MQPRRGKDSYKFQQKQARRTEFRRRRLFVLAGILLAMSLGIILTVYAARMTAPPTDVFVENVYVDNVPLVGMTREQAEAVLLDANRERIQAMALTFTYEGKSYPLKPEDMGVKLHFDEALMQAFMQGKEESWQERRAAAGEREENPYEASSTITYDAVMLANAVEKIAGQIEKAPIDATITMDAPAAEGADPDFHTTPEQDGRTCDPKPLIVQARALLDKNVGGSIAMTTIPVRPAITAESLRKATHKIVTASTELARTSTEDRNFNIEQALSHYNGLVLAPGQEVSFNDLVGPRTEDAGYRIATVIRNNTYVDGLGGGVCQASTTVYHAAVRAGLEIVKRDHHSMYSSYVPLGQDATVDYPSLDLVIKNNTELPVFFLAGINGRKVNVTVYGRPLEDGVSIKIVTEVLEEGVAPDPDVIIDADPQNLIIPKGKEVYDSVKSRPRYKVKTYRVFEKDGKETKRVGLYTDTYKEIVGTRYLRALPPPSTPNPDGTMPLPTPTLRLVTPTPTPKPTKTPAKTTPKGTAKPTPKPSTPRP